MSRSLLTRAAWLLTCLVAIAAATAPLAERVLERRFGDPRRAKLEAALGGEEAEEAGQALKDQAFDQPDDAIAFYANSRTGPILTRGSQPTTGVRPLDAAAYLPALRQMRAMPRYSSATGSLLPSADDDRDGAAASPGATLTTWSNLGPTNQGGRTRALLIDPGNPNVMYAGGVAGGVWKTTDGGGNWSALAQLQMPNLAVVSLAFDPTTTATLYAGTGEGVGNADGIRGAGIFKSTDAGVTWTQLPSTANSTFDYTMSVVVSPRNPLRIYAGTRTGLYRSTNGGTTWSTLATNSSGCTQVALQPSGATGYVFASCGNFNQGAVYRGTDDDASSVGIVFNPTGMGRSSIAIAPSNQAVVYVVAAQSTAGLGPGRYGLHGVYRSTTNGDLGSFTTQRAGNVAPANTAEKINQLLFTNPVIGLLTECGFGTSSTNNQGWYDNVVAVDPLDANRVWVGGIDLWRSDDGGVTWGTAGFWWFDKGVDPEYHHADQHGIVFHPGYDGTSNKVLFSLSDGGVERIDDARANVNTTLTQLCGTPVAGGPSWVDRNGGYVTTQFYDGSVYPDGSAFFGGLQDNGTQRGTPAGATWSMLRGGDGGYTAIDTLGDGTPGNDVLFLENTGLSIQRSTNGGGSFSSVITGITGDTGFGFITPFAMNQGNKQQLWIGGFLIWRTTNQGTSWVQASQTTAGLGYVSAIATHPLDGDRVLVGMSDGYIHDSTTALSADATTVWPSTRPATGFISWLAWDPNNLNVAYATVSAFGTTNLFKSVDSGTTWVPAVGSGGTALPQIPALTVVVNPADSLQVFVGTDLGVFTSIDGGDHWYLENTGFANTPVEALKFNETAPRQLYAFTHGRGAWRVALNAAAPTAPVSVNDSYTTPFNTPLTVPAPGVLGNDNPNGGGAMTAVLDSTTGTGTLALNANGGFTFTPTAGFSGVTTFTYHPTNGNGAGNVATVSITVQGAGVVPPTASNDSYGTPFDTPLTVAAPGVLGNDTPNGGGAMTAVLDSTTAGGTLTLSASGGFTFTPTAGVSGATTFTYHVTNANGASNVATVTITVAPAPGPQPPTNFRITGMSRNVVSFGWALPTSGPAPIAIQLEGGLTPGSVLGVLPLGPNPGATLTLPTGSFFIRLRTITAAGVSGPSNEILANIAVPVAPSAPAALLGLANGPNLALAWSPTFDGGEPTGAVLDVGGAVAASLPLGRVDTFAFAGVPAGTYTFSVRQTNAVGSSAGSSPITLTFPGGCAGAPQPPRNFTAFNAGGVLQLYWDPPAAGAAPTAYTLNVGGSFVGALPMASRSLAVVPPPGTFTLSVTAANPCGASAPTPTATVTFP